MHRRISITLPDAKVRLADRVRKARLRRLLKEGALRNAERDRKIAEEWSALGEAPWSEDPE